MENLTISWTNRQIMDNLVTVGDVLSDALGSVWHHVHFDVRTIPWSLVTKDFKDFYYPITCNRVIQSAPLGAPTMRSGVGKSRRWLGKPIRSIDFHAKCRRFFPCVRCLPSFELSETFLICFFLNGKWMVSVSVNLGNIGTWISKHLCLNSGRQPAQCWTGELA